MNMYAMDTRAARLRELTTLIETLTAEADSIRDEFKAAMVAAGDEVLTGNGWKATWKTVTSTRLDTAALKKDMPDIAAKYSKTSTTSRFCFS